MLDLWNNLDENKHSASKLVWRCVLQSPGGDEIIEEIPLDERCQQSIDVASFLLRKYSSSHRLRSIALTANTKASN